MFTASTMNLRPAADPAAIVQGKTYRFTVLTERLIRMEWSEDGSFEDRATKLVTCRRFPVPRFTVKETEDSLEIITDKLHVYYDKQKFSRGGLSIAVKGMIKHKCARWQFGMPIYTILGRSTNLYGTCTTLDMVDGACELGTGVIDRMGYVALDDSHATVLNEDGWYVPAERGDAIDTYFFGYNYEHKDCLRDFYRLSGATPMLPRYALGNWWSRYYKYTEESYEDLMNKFAERKVPLAVSVVDMDWHITQPDQKYGNGWTGYTWNREMFPDPERFLNWLHDHNLHVTLNIHPHDGIRAFEDCYPNAARAMGIDPETEEPVDFDVSDPKMIRTYLDEVLHPLEDQGVDFWWIDWQQKDGFRKDGYDPLWVLNHYLYTDNARKGSYPMILSRYAGPGSHRYPLGFSGDSIMSWASLDFQPYFTACASNIGYGWWSHDIGGHKNGIWSDDMQVRWTQYGVFSPIYRPHSGKDLFFLKEPWNFPTQVENILEDFMRLRHALIPYLYTMNYRAHAEGLPLCTPLYYDYPKLTNELNFYKNQYFFGSELMVAPITAPLDPRTQTGCVKALIPEGIWFDFFTGRRYTGEKPLMLFRTQDTIPVLAKAGGIVPMADDGFVNGAPLPKNLRLRVFAGADGAFRMYEDDEQLENTRSAVTPFTFGWGKTAVFTKAPVEGDSALLPVSRAYRLELTGCEAPASVTAEVNGKPVSIGWSYCEKTHTLYADPVTAAAKDALTIRVVTTGGLASGDYKRELSARLARWQIECRTKQTIQAAIDESRSPLDLLVRLPAICPEETSALGEMTEILSAAE